MAHEPTPARTGQTLAAKLNHLFATRLRPEGKEYSNEQVATAILATKSVKTLSQSYIWQLRNGVKDNPTVRHLQGLANFFEVPVAYFFDDDVSDRVDQQLEEIRAARDQLTELAASSELQLLAMRAGELSPARRQQVIDLLDVVYRLEQAERGDHPIGSGGTNDGS